MKYLNTAEPLLKKISNETLYEMKCFYGTVKFSFKIFYV